MTFDVSRAVLFRKIKIAKTSVFIYLKFDVLAIFSHTMTKDFGL